MRRALSAVLLAAASAQPQQDEPRNRTPEIVAEDARRVVVSPDRAAIHLTVDVRPPFAVTGRA